MVYQTLGVAVDPPRPVSFEDWLKNPGLNVLITDVATAPTHTDVNVPGCMTSAHASTIISALVMLKDDIKKADYASDPPAVFQLAVVTAAIQLMVTYSTAAAVNDDKNFTVTLGKGELTYSELRETVRVAAANWGYPNPLRSFGRRLSPLTIQLCAAGKVEPNVRVCTAHGIPPQYYPFSADYLMVDARRWGYEASVAATMGRIVALNSTCPEKDESKVFNTFERSDAMKGIFTKVPCANSTN